MVRIRARTDFIVTKHYSHDTCTHTYYYPNCVFNSRSNPLPGPGPGPGPVEGGVQGGRIGEIRESGSGSRSRSRVCRGI
jgi:hypothetical protein